MDEEEMRERARKRVKKIRDFYGSLITYILVNLLLLAVNLLTNPKHLWFYWVALIWGVAIIFQAFNTFTIKDRFLGEQWEKRKLDELLDKEKNNNSKGSKNSS